MNVLVGGFTFLLSRLFSLLCVCVKGSDTAVLLLFQFGPYVEKSCVMLHYVFIHTWTLTETFTMPLGFLHCAACPLFIIIIIFFISLSVKSSVTVDGMRCCFICWQREQQCVAAVLCCEFVEDASHLSCTIFHFFVVLLAVILSDISL